MRKFHIESRIQLASANLLNLFIRKYLNVQTSLQRPAVNIQFTKTDEEIASARVAFAAIVRHCYI